MKLYRLMTSITLCFLMLGLVGSLAVAQTAPAKEQTTCPVMGGKINKGIFVEHEGQRIYLCCPACIEKFKADPKAYAKKLQDEGVALEKVQTTCPIEGGAIDKKISADQDGKRVYFCCQDCVAKFKADPGAAMKKLQEQGVTAEPLSCTKDAKACPKASTCPKAGPDCPKPACPSTGAAPAAKKGCCSK